jgi:hypothetical protein
MNLNIEINKTKQIKKKEKKTSTRNFTLVKHLV